MRALQAQIGELEDQVADIRRRTYNPSEPAFKVPQQQLAQARRELAALQARLARDLAASPDASSGAPSGTIAGDIRERQDNLAVLRLIDEALAEDIKRFEDESRQMARNTLDLKEEQDRYALADETAQKVGSEIQAVEVEQRARARVEEVDRAKLPLTKDDSKKVKMTGMAGLGSFAMVLVGLTLLEYRARRVNTEQDVVRNLGIRLVGVLPDASQRAPRRARSSPSGAAANWSNALIESIDATRTMLLHASHTDSVRVVMVTSALKGEGKTSLSSQLATSLARGGMKTLLIDCDFRRSALHRLFDVPNEPGLCELLRGETTPADTIQPTTVDGLSLVTAGGFDPAALQALAQGGGRRLFDEFKADFDYVVVDSAPVLPLADSLLVGQQVDAVLLSVLRDVSRLPQIQAAHQRLRELDIPVLGAVVNGAARLSHGYAGYYVYG